MGRLLRVFTVRDASSFPPQPAPIPYVAVPEGSAPKKSVLRTLLTRMAVGLVMIVCFLGILYSHHWVVVGFVGVVQIMSFRELLAVRHKEVKEQQIPWFRSLSWLAFAIVEFAAYGQQVLHALRLTMVPVLGALPRGWFRSALGPVG